MNALITSLHVNYQPKLDVVWALREIGSNAIDGEERNKHLGIGKMEISYSKRTGQLVIANDGVIVPTTALLMGTSESRGDVNCIGQFGEGLPMALLVLARNHVPVTVVNGEEKWEPVIERSGDYQGEPVLTIHRRKLKVNRHAYIVQIDNVTPDLYQQFLSLYLRFDPRFDAAATISARYSQERVLMQPIYRGSIYNKGVFVCRRNDLMFGYDLHGELNRDRSLMDEYSLKENLSSLLSKCGSNETFSSMLAEMLLDAKDLLEVRDEYSTLVYTTEVCEKVVKAFAERFGEDAIAVSSEQEVKEAESYGVKGIISSPVIRRIVERSVIGTLTNVRTKQATSVQHTWSETELGCKEANNFIMCLRLVQSSFAPARDQTFVIVSFGSSTVKFTHDKEAMQIRINHELLFDMEALLVSMVRASILMSGLSVEAHDVLAKMVIQLACGQGTASLALALMAEA